ncbi:hypothetical protein PVT71_20445 [Salipiger sp. H15]|uniref:Uncharacterized protein n=1 Tax=Alloyangia sp. H15 TaxID=3029062 RepID=A0AAU8AL17_9RHOB
MLALAVGAMQMLLDGGEAVEWFASAETWIYLGLSVSGLWVFLVHCWTARTPFVDLAIFRDRNVVMGPAFMFLLGMTLFSGLALLSPLLQKPMSSPVVYSSLVMVPGGVAARR